MKLIKIGLLLAVLATAVTTAAPFAAAQYYYGRTPSLSVSQEGYDGTFRVNVSNADSYARVVLYARSTNSSIWSTVVDPIGQTDQNGYLNISTYLGTGLSEFYAQVNNVSSNTAYLYGSGGCNSGYGCVGGITFSPQNPSLNVGQNLSVTINQPYFYYGTYYISSNSNSSVVSASISGSSINLYGLSSGSSTLSVCQNNSGTCGNLYVTVSGGSNYGNVWFSPQNPSLYVGQSLAVSINSSATVSSYTSNYYYISSNSNSNAVSASISGSVLNLYANQNGNATISVCHSSLGFCGSLYVTVSGSGNYGNVSLSQTTLSLGYGQNSTLSIYSSNASLGGYYISSNSNSNAVAASISGSSLYLTAQNYGNSTISVCQNNNSGCASVYVTVSGSGSGSVWFSPSSITLYSGQTMTLSIYSSNAYNGNYYVSSNSNTFAVSTSVSGNQMTLTAKSSGTANITVCQSGNSSVCGNLTAVVYGNSYGGNLSFSQNNVSLQQGQNVSISIYGSGNYYVSSGSNQNAFSASISGNSVNIYGLSSGSGNLTICQNYQNLCGTIYVSVGSGTNYNGSLTFSTASLPAMTIGQYYNHQLSVYGGNPPYSFQLVSGQLPLGINLSPQGQLYGTPQSANTSTFSVRAYDNFGRSAISSFVIYGSGVLGQTTYKNGKLIKEGATIYIVYKNTKSGFKNMSVFWGLGYKSSNVASVYDTGLVDSGYVVNSTKIAHPWGSWLKSGNTIYFAHELGLIPISSWEVFVNNGGESGNIVPANIYDFQRPILSVMEYNDPRLR